MGKPRNKSWHKVQPKDQKDDKYKDAPRGPKKGKKRASH